MSVGDGRDWYEEVLRYTVRELRDDNAIGESCGPSARLRTVAISHALDMIETAAAPAPLAIWDGEERRIVARLRPIASPGVEE